ncbi:ABC transporter permease [Ornithinimicrobium cavernae]|uniref:ABC transporter permease n=1 Tax=Ornithinimicrobium cavernae TaxID=2666047 RepID=UPI000D685FEE|nr:ABC transporter permease [Ornithinimicrobium cavernae]
MQGVGVLIGLAVRRSRWFWVAWLAVLAAVVPLTATAYETIIPDPAAASRTIESLSDNPTMRAIFGPPTSLVGAGGFTVWRVGTFAATVAGVMAVLGIVRTTRADEESGRTELVRSAVVGRHAPLTASLVVCLGACLVLGTLVAAGMTVVRTGLLGSLVFGAGTALTAAVFVGVGAVTAQLTSSARAARGAALATLVTAYLIRAVADGAPEGSALRPLAWASPVEWMALSRPYAGERPLVLLLPLALTLLLTGLAVTLEARRDHGSGLWAERRGAATAAPWLAGPLGLAWRLQRGSIAGWCVGLLVFGALMGSVATGFEEMLADTPQLAEALRRMGQDADVLTDAFFVAMLGLLVIMAAAMALQVLGRLHHEEESGHVDAVLATAVPRTRFAASHLALALGVPTLLFPLVGALLGTALALTSGGWGPVVAAGQGAAALLPGVWLVVGLGALVHGTLPGLSPLPWAVVAWSLLVGLLGEVIGLPGWLTGLTPFAQLAAVPVEPFAWTPVAVTTALALLLVAGGLLGYSRRDILTR